MFLLLLIVLAVLLFWGLTDPRDRNEQSFSDRVAQLERGRRIRFLLLALGVIIADILLWLINSSTDGALPWGAFAVVFIIATIGLVAAPMKRVRHSVIGILALTWIFTICMWRASYGGGDFVAGLAVLTVVFLVPAAAIMLFLAKGDQEGASSWM